jgi:membrane protein
MLFALVSIYGLVADAGTIERHLSWLSGLLPQSALELVRGQLRSLVATSRTVLGWGTAISILVALWSSARGSAALIEGLNVAYAQSEERGFIRQRVTALAFSLGLVMFLLVSAALIAAVPNLIGLLRLPQPLRVAGLVAQWALLVALVLVMLRLVYRHAPARAVRPGGWTTPGAIVGAVLWLAASALFSWYAASFGRFDQTHGALGAVVALLLWLHISALVVLLGAELDAALERRRPSARPVR